jgi:hypothetical protein
MEQITKFILEYSNDFYCFVKSVPSLLADLWLDGWLISQFLKCRLEMEKQGNWNIASQHFIIEYIFTICIYIPMK